MAGQSSSHHGERPHRSERERERSSSSHHHNRTISSTTLLLVLSLVLAVLAVMLSLPSGSSSSGSGAEPQSGGIFASLTPKRSQALIAREGAVAVREAEVARREAEILVGAPGGVIGNPTAACAPCIAATTIETVLGPVQTVIKEIVKEDSLTPPGWTTPRIEDIIERELRIAEREREISKREEQANRREHDASRRENWIMEQLLALGNDVPQSVEEEYVYEAPPIKRNVKAKYHQLPPQIYEYEEPVVVETVSGPPPANTRLAAFPTPEAASHTSTEFSPRTTVVEIVREEPPPRLAKPIPRGPGLRAPARFAGGW
ncbi:hypothetical protein FA15DRAFT_580733 [Coprinopsis marcescibilis]|uniref:Transmembrane protein n=1 Tax=Coprinopsis marcescibilis TaxID=230819 RepID=A0A5C3LBA8_COPMA|nr:hypothetical protein FA15DRAFT_580733 [Coprinopsis marcescibilis]